MANLIGLDLGSRSIKAVGLNQTKEGYSVSTLAHAELPFPEEEIPREDLLRENLKRFVKESGVKMKSVAVSLPRAARSTRLPLSRIASESAACQSCAIPGRASQPASHCRFAAE